jgi:hypothetical protein
LIFPLGGASHIPIDLDYMWNYSFYKLMDLGVEIDEDWYSDGNIEYEALDDLRGVILLLFEDDVVPIGDWEETARQPTEHNIDDSTNGR